LWWIGVPSWWRWLSGYNTENMTNNKQYNYSYIPCINYKSLVTDRQ
jgi:hypothetical protein